MFYLIQALTVLYAVFLAFLNEVPVIKMINNGASIREEKRFHAANFLVKLIYALVITLALDVSFTQSIISFLILGFWLWLVFDIALNLFLRKTWDYLGDTAWFDKKITALFPHGDAGEAKAIVCVCAIILLNILKAI